MKSTQALGTSIRVKIMKMILSFPRMVKCLLLSRLLGWASAGRRAEGISFKRQKKESVLISLVEKGAFLGPAQDSLIPGTRRLLSETVHIHILEDDPLSTFRELPFLSWHKFRMSLCLSRLKRKVGERWRESLLITERKRKSSPYFPSRDCLCISSSFLREGTPPLVPLPSLQCCYQYAHVVILGLILFPHTEWSSQLTTP